MKDYSRPAVESRETLTWSEEVCVCRKEEAGKGKDTLDRAENEIIHAAAQGAKIKSQLSFF